MKEPMEIIALFDDKGQPTTEMKSDECFVCTQQGIAVVSDMWEDEDGEYRIQVKEFCQATNRELLNCIN